MNDFSIIDKLKILTGIITSSPVYLVCSIVGILLLIFIIICIIFNKKMNKWIFIGGWALIFVLLLIRYNSYFLKLLDNFFNNVFMALYFPNLSIYLIILISSNVLFIYSFIKKNINKVNKIINIINAIVINSLFILIINLVVKNNINVYDTLTTYSNSELLVLIELTSAIFTSSLLLVVLSSAYSKLKKFDKKVYPKMEEIIFEEEIPTFKNDKMYVWKKIIK